MPLTFTNDHLNRQQRGEASSPFLYKQFAGERVVVSVSKRFYGIFLKVTAKTSCVWPAFSLCATAAPAAGFGAGWLWAGASRGGWRPSASSAAPWVSSCRSGSRSSIGWQPGHCRGCRSWQTLRGGGEKGQSDAVRRRGAGLEGVGGGGVTDEWAMSLMKQSWLIRMKSFHDTKHHSHPKKTHYWLKTLYNDNCINIISIRQEVVFFVALTQWSSEIVHSAASTGKKNALVLKFVSSLSQFFMLPTFSPLYFFFLHK